MTIVVHASDCKATQCKPIDKQSALIVAIRPAQRNMIARLGNTSIKVKQSRCARACAFAFRIWICASGIEGERLGPKFV